ncbi:MAG TPA: hypothetical protein VI685_02460, partial [Candidatus Angelobacter sp.]
FLKDHPETREELKENASQFMRREQRFDTAENTRAKSSLSAQNPDLTPKEVAAFDKFLDHHKGIDKDLEKNPNLINDPKFVKDHSDLRKFMEKHPEVREEFKESPSNFMKQESRFERSDRDHDRIARSDKDDHRKDRDRDKDARADKDDHKKDRDRHDKTARADKDKHKMDKDQKSTLDDKAKLQTSNPH